MDKDAEIQKVQDEIDYIVGWKDHAITKKLFSDSRAAQEALITLICNQPISSVETFFAHFEAVGHLRGLRQPEATVLDWIAELKNQKKELE